MKRARTLVAAAAFAFAAFAAFAAACSGGGDADPTAAPSAATTPAITREASPEATPPPPATPSVDIRTLDLASLPEVAALLSDRTGQIVQDDVIYADLTRDAHDDAVAPVSVDGTLGHVGFVALAAEGDSAAVLLAEFPESVGGIEVAVEGDTVVMTQPVPGPDDPECCPSLLRRTVYGWNGSALAVESVETEENPAGGGKKTSTPPPPSSSQ